MCVKSNLKSRMTCCIQHNIEYFYLVTRLRAVTKKTKLCIHGQFNVENLSKFSFKRKTRMLQSVDMITLNENKCTSIFCTSDILQNMSHHIYCLLQGSFDIVILNSVLCDLFDLVYFFGIIQNVMPCLVIQMMP